LWLGTQDSLIRFDGIRFREFQDGNSVLHGRLIHALAEDGGGNLWVGSLGGGVVRIAPNGRTREYERKDGLASASVFCLVAAHDGSIWACTAEGLSQITDNRVRTFTTSDGLPSNRIRSACETRDGTLWVAGLDFGLSRWSGSRFEPRDLPEVGPRQNVTALACAGDNSIWIGTTRGLFRISGSSTQSYPQVGGPPDDEISALFEGSGGALWIGTSKGISRLRNGEISTYGTGEGLSHSQVLAFYLDREGTLWAGTKNGLDQFTDGKATPFTVHEGLSSNETGPILEDRSGRLWIGTLDRGVDVFDGTRFRNFTTANGLLSNTVLSLTAGVGADIWVGTARGVNRLTRGGVTAAYGARSGIANGVRSLYMDERGTLWAATGSGLRRLEGEHFVPVTGTPAASQSAAIHPIPLFDASENPGLWLSQQEKPWFLPLNISHAIECFSYDPANRSLWMGTLGSGLVRWQNGSIAHIYAKDGLYDTRISSILRDGGEFWVASSKGIFRLDARELNDFADGRRTSIRSYPFPTGQLRFECRSGIQPGACRTRDGHLWFSTSNGLVVIRPDRISGNPVPPPAAITALIANGRRIAEKGPSTLKARDANNLEIRYAGLSFINPEKVSFRYHLKGYDRDWVDAGSRREAFYTNLPPGNFRFEVEARSADGLWSVTPAALTFSIEPLLYQRRWFWLVATIALLLAMFAAVRLRIRQIRARFALVLSERTRIARELHDTLLQGLSGITMQLQALATRMPQGQEQRLLSEVIRDAAHAATEARRSLWALRSSCAAPDFSEKLAALVRQTLNGQHIGVSLALEAVSLAGLPDCEFQLLRIAREALTNTLKHAVALHLWITLAKENDVLHLAIEDDGLGFTSDSDGSLHFGIRGMHERAREIGAKLKVASVPGSGTRITVELPFRTKLESAGNHSGSYLHQLS
jgi:signal transduction histidine kinase/ligand-binding sensor domain-containing protein